MNASADMALEASMIDGVFVDGDEVLDKRITLTLVSRMDESGTAEFDRLIESDESTIADIRAHVRRAVPNMQQLIDSMTVGARGETHTVATVARQPSSPARIEPETHPFAQLYARAFAIVVTIFLGLAGVAVVHTLTTGGSFR